MAPRYDLVVLGELNVDLILTGDTAPVWGQTEKLVEDARLVMGGSSAIFACGAARLGLSTAFVGAIGDDMFGQFMREQLVGAGVDAERLVVDPDIRTGITIHLSRADGERAMLTYLGSIAALRAEQVDPALLRATRYLHAGSYFLQHALQPGLPALFAQAHAAGVITSLDTNWDPDERWDSGLEAVLAQTDIFLPNDAEARNIAGIDNPTEALDRLAERVPLVAVKRGADGAAVARGPERLALPPPQIVPVDTTGAGDSFDAGFIAGHARGLPLQHNLAVAIACGSLNTREVGGTAAQATWEEAWSVARELIPE